MRNTYGAVIVGMSVLLAGVTHAQQEPVFRGIQPKHTIIDAWQKEQKTNTSAHGTSAPTAPRVTAKSRVPAADTGVPLSFLIIFEFNSAELTDAAKQQLDGIAEAIKSSELAGSSFKIEGHTDVIGSEPYNLELSRRRARAVVEYLVETHRVDASKLTAVGVGERDLYNAADPTAEENRRVRFIRYAG